MAGNQEVLITAIFFSHLRRSPRLQELQFWQSVFSADKSLEIIEREFQEEYKVEIMERVLRPLFA